MTRTPPVLCFSATVDEALPLPEQGVGQMIQYLYESAGLHTDMASIIILRITHTNRRMCQVCDFCYTLEEMECEEKDGVC